MSYGESGEMDRAMVVSTLGNSSSSFCVAMLISLKNSQVGLRPLRLISFFAAWISVTAGR